MRIQLLPFLLTLASALPLEAGQLKFTITGKVGTIVTASGDAADLIQTGMDFRFVFTLDEAPVFYSSPATALFIAQPTTYEFVGNGQGPGARNVSFQFPTSGYNLAFTFAPEWRPDDLLDIIFGGPTLFTGPGTAPQFTPGLYTLTNNSIRPWSIQYGGGGFTGHLEARFAGDVALLIEEVPEPAAAVLAAPVLVLLTVLRQRGPKLF